MGKCSFAVPEPADDTVCVCDATEWVWFALTLPVVAVWQWSALYWQVYSAPCSVAPDVQVTEV